MSTDSAHRRFIPRISLLTALLFVTIAALAVALWQLNRELTPLRAEVRKLREEVGQLTIDDPNKIYAIQVHSPRSDMHRYRVYLPENRKFLIHLGVHQVAGRKPGQSRSDGFKYVIDKRSGSDSGIQSGEFIIDVELQQDLDTPDSDNWNLGYRINNAGGGAVASTIPWLKDRRVWSISGEAPLGKQVELAADDGRQAKLTEFEGGYSKYPPDETKDSPGLILWISPEAPTAILSR